MKEVNLLTAELAYLFSLIRVESAIGVEEGLFPKEGAARAKLYKIGYEALKGHALITAGNQSGGDQLNPELLALVATVAEPRFAIVTDIREHPATHPKRLVHYFSRHSIVEQTFHGAAGYRLTELSDERETFFRIVRAIGVPEKNRVGEHVIALKASLLTKIKHSVERGAPQQALAEFQKLNVDETAAKAAILSMAQPKINGTCSLFGLDGQTIQNANGLAFFIGEGSGWVVIPGESPDDDVGLRTANDVEFWAFLTGLFGALAT